MRLKSSLGWGRASVPNSIFLIIVLIGIAALAIGLLTSGGSTPDDSGSTSDPGCDTPAPRETCYSVEVEGVTVRYSIVQAGLPVEDEQLVTSPAVIYDPGGPGASVLSGSSNLANVQANLAGGRFTLIALEEPWVSGEYSEACATAATSYYTAVREERSADLLTEGDSLRTTCGLGSGRYGFTPEIYTGAIEAILSRHHLELDGFFGHSFASVRLTYLEATNTLQPGWAVLTKPFPVGASAEDLIAARADAIAAQADSVQKYETPGSTAEGRSLPLTRTDYWSALIELGYLSRESFDTAITSLNGDEAPQMIGAFSDQLWGRYGIDSISPGTIAQIEEVCSAAGGLDRVPTPEEDGIAYVLTAFLATCPADTEPQVGGMERDNLCVTVGDGDTVTPESLVRASFPTATIIETGLASHSDITDWDSCLERLGVG